MTGSKILQNDSLEAFFYHALEAEEFEGALSGEVSAYLVHLLANYTRKVGDAGRASAAFALQYMEAAQQGSTALRAVGDRALFVAGVMPGSLDRTAVGVDYVCSIGSRAYRAVFDQHRRLELFCELSEEFGRIVDVVSRVASPGSKDSVGDLLAIYDRWRADGSRADARILADAGVLLDRDHSDDLH